MNLLFWFVLVGHSPGPGHKGIGGGQRQGLTGWGKVEEKHQVLSASASFCLRGVISQESPGPSG